MTNHRTRLSNVGSYIGHSKSAPTEGTGGTEEDPCGFWGTIPGEKLLGHCKCLFEMEVVAMDETTTDRTMDELRAIFAWWGIPLQMVTDNGPQFTSAGFKLFPGLE